MSAESRKEVLDLLAQGKISVDEAASMLAAVKEPTAVSPEQPANLDAVSPAPPPTPEPAAAPDPVAEPAAVKMAPSGEKPKWLRVRVSNLESGKSRVSVNIPVRMLKFGFTVASHFTPEVGSLSIDELQDMLLDSEGGMLVDVQDTDSNEHVQVFLE